MTALQSSPDVHDPATTGGSRLLAGTGAALVASGLVQLADELLAGPQVEIVDTLWFRLSSGLHLVSFVLLVLCTAVVSARRWAGSGGGARAVDGLMTVGAVLAACAMWEIAFVSPVLADVAPQLVNAEPGTLGLGLNLSLAVFTLALISLGTALLRAGRVSRRTAGLVLASGLLFVVVPAAQLVLGLGLLSGRDQR